MRTHLCIIGWERRHDGKGWMSSDEPWLFARYPAAAEGFTEFGPRGKVAKSQYLTHFYSIDLIDLWNLWFFTHNIYYFTLRPISTLYLGIWFVCEYNPMFFLASESEDTSTDNLDNFVFPFVILKPISTRSIENTDPIIRMDEEVEHEYLLSTVHITVAANVDIQLSSSPAKRN